MAKIYSTFLRSPEMESHYQMLFSFISRTFLLESLTPLKKIELLCSKPLKAGELLDHSHLYLKMNARLKHCLTLSVGFRICKFVKNLDFLKRVPGYDSEMHLVVRRQFYSSGGLWSHSSIAITPRFTLTHCSSTC